MGMSHLVYPGAHHTRFPPCVWLYAYHAKAIGSNCALKGVSISIKEENALYITILLYDIGRSILACYGNHSIVENIP